VTADAADRWLQRIADQLREIGATLARDLDIAPAQRLRFEGFIAAAHADGVSLQELFEFCSAQIPTSCSVMFDEQHQTLLLDCRQKRAPVCPSTSD